MIGDFIFASAAAILGILGLLFSTISYIVPDEIENAIITVVGYARYVKGIFPIDTLLQGIGVYLTVATLMYTVKLILWAYAHLPWIGRHHKLPRL